MSQLPALIIPRSGSLATSASSPAAQHVGTRGSISIADAPITPPMSPGHSEQDLGEENDIVVDAEPRYSGPASATTIEHSAADMDVDSAPHMPVVEPPSPAQSTGGESTAQRPLRLLEDEKVHLQKSGLKLTDFEVRGTLGTFAIPLCLCTSLTLPSLRYGDIWPRSACSA